MLRQITSPPRWVGIDTEQMGRSMLRKTLTTMAVAVIGAFAFGGVAVAAPPPSYEPPGVVSVAVDDELVNAGTQTTFSGDGFDPGEGIDITVTYLGASGLTWIGGPVPHDRRGNHGRRER